MNKLADDCFIHDKDRMTHFDAVELLKSRMKPMVGQEKINLDNAVGRILAENVIAPRDIPAFDNSAVDGYAFSHSEYSLNGGFFPISVRVAAGDKPSGPLAGFSAARVFTGAAMPDGANTVAMQEDCETHEADGKLFVTIPSGLEKRANCRMAGEDVEAGQTVAQSQHILHPQQLAAIASTGTAKVTVNKPLRIALLSSGNEIVRPGKKYSDGKVFDANYFMLQGLLANPNIQVTDLGICPDSADKLNKLLSDTAKTHDVIISSGGASRGEEDYFVSALETLGTCHLWQLAVKPGRPMSFGQISGTPCFTLPGNPVAAFVCFLLYVYPSLICLAGGTWKEPVRIPVPAAFSVKSKPDRREYLRGYLIDGLNNRVMAQKFSQDGSGIISGLTTASGLIEVTEETTRISEGDLVNFLPFSGLIS